MDSFRRLSVVLVLPLAAFVSCGSPKSFDSSRVSVTQPKAEQPRMSFANLPVQAADMASEQMLAGLKFAEAVGAIHVQEQPRPHVEPAPVVTIPAQPPVTTVAPTPSTPSSWWDCVALHETGSNWTMHGSSYSSALGVMNQAVRENATEEVAARILSGTASRQEQIDMAQRILDRFGKWAWADQTVLRCGG